MNKYTIRDPRCGNWPCHNSELMVLVANAVLEKDKVKIEFPSGSKWPDTGILPVIVQGVKVWVNPIPAVKPPRKSSKHRAMCECPGCGQEMSVGRLHQHKCEKV